MAKKKHKNNNYEVRTLDTAKLKKYQTNTTV